MADQRLVPPSINDLRSLTFLELVERLAVLPNSGEAVLELGDGITFLDLGDGQTLLGNGSTQPATIDIDDRLNIYDFDNVEATALPHLAEQFNVTGFRGWLLAKDEATKRALLKRAIELHRYQGTPWAVRTALETLDYTDVVIVENPEIGAGNRYYDGIYYYDGAETYGGTLLGAFIVNLNTGGTITTEERNLIIELINQWKNVRSHLVELNTTERLRYNARGKYNDQWTWEGLPK